MRMCARCQLSRGVDSCCQPCACFLSSLVISRFPLGWLLQAGHKLFWFFGDSRIGLSYLGRWVAKDVWEALGQWNQRLGFVERFLRHSMIFNHPMAPKKSTQRSYLKIQDLDRKVRAVIRYLPSTILFFYDVYYILTGCLCWSQVSTAPLQHVRRARIGIRLSSSWRRLLAPMDLGWVVDMTYIYRFLEKLAGETSKDFLEISPLTLGRWSTFCSFFSDGLKLLVPTNNVSSRNIAYGTPTSGRLCLGLEVSGKGVGLCRGIV